MEKSNLPNASLSVYTDGGSRGNPGPAACAFVIKTDHQIIHEASRYLDQNTNNFAEYHGLLLALDYLLSQPSLLSSYTHLDFYLDSELVVRQLTGVYKVKHPQIIPLVNLVKQKLAQLPLPYDFSHILRSLNSRADALVNQELDKNLS